MILILCGLIILRLFMWRIFPQYGTGFIADIVFGMICLTTLTFRALYKSSSSFAPWIAFLIAAITLSFFANHAPMPTFTGWFSFLTYILLFCSVKKALKVKSYAGVIWGVMYLGAILSAAIGIWEFFILHTVQFPGSADRNIKMAWDMKRACSLQGWPIAFAGYLIMFVPTAILMFKEKQSWIRGVCLGLILAGLFSSLSALAVGSLIAAMLITRSSKDHKWVWGFLLILFFFVFGTKVLDNFFLARQEYYQTAWDLIGQHPFFGSGWGTFKSLGASKSLYAHNSYLQIWAETGPLGLFAIVGLVVTFWKMKPAKDNPLLNSIYIGLLAVFIDNFFSFTMIKPNLSLMFWIGLAVYSSLWRKESNGSDLRD